MIPGKVCRASIIGTGDIPSRGKTVSAMAAKTVFLFSFVKKNGSILRSLRIFY